MSRNIVLELFLIALVVLFWIPGASAFPNYLDAYNSTFSTNASCGICHVNPADGGPRNSYGMQFENQTNYANDPGAALIAIGPAGPGTTSTAMATATATSMVTAISTATPTVTETSIPLETPLVTETPLATETPIPVVTTPAPSAPGFGQGIFIIGLLACCFILRRHNNN